jgi:hypothetical protein
MGKQKKKTCRDVAEIALSVVERAIGEKLAGKPTPAEPSEPDTRNPAAVALSKLGASKGGKARAATLGPQKKQPNCKTSGESPLVL